MSSAALFLGESVTPLRWCAAALLVGGVALTTLTPARRSTVPAATATATADAEEPVAVPALLRPRP